MAKIFLDCIVFLGIRILCVILYMHYQNTVYLMYNHNISISDLTDELIHVIKEPVESSHRVTVVYCEEVISQANRISTISIKCRLSKRASAPFLDHIFRKNKLLCSL